MTPVAHPALISSQCRRHVQLSVGNRQH